MSKDTRRMICKIEAQLDELAEIRAVWDKHHMPVRGNRLSTTVNEVLLHYKGFLKAEKDAKDAAWRNRYRECFDDAKREEQACKIPVHRRGIVAPLRTGAWSDPNGKTVYYCNQCGKGEADCACTDMEGLIASALASEPGPLHAWGVAEKNAQFEDNKPCPHHETKHDNITGHWYCKECGKCFMPPELIT